MFIEWGEALERREHSLMGGRSLRDARLIARSVAWWAGCGDPYANGPGQCVHASYIIRHLLAAGGVDNEALTVQVTVEFPEGSPVVVGSRRPRLRRSLQGIRYWTGHEVVHIPQWNLVVDATLFQVANDIPTAGLLEPVLIRPGQVVPSKLRPGDRLRGDLSNPGWQVEYLVGQPDYSYRDDPDWGWQESELHRALEHGMRVWRRDGLLVACSP